MNIDWTDFNIGLVVKTKEGEGMVLSIDKPKDEVGVKLFDGEYKKFKISELYMKMGQLKISLTARTGEFILLFQRIENRLRDFVNYSLSLNRNQKNILTSNFTAGKLIDTTGKLIKKHAEELHYKTWRDIKKELIDLNTIRNTIIHGYLFHYNDEFELDYNSLYIENANGNKEILNIEKLNDLTSRTIKVYYDILGLFNVIPDSIKVKVSENI